VQICRCDVCGDNVKNVNSFYCPSDVWPKDLEVNLEMCEKCWFEYDTERKRYHESIEKEAIIYLRDLLSKMRIGIDLSKQ